MSKEEIDLLKVQLLLDYYKNKDITQHYRTLIENNIVFDNDTLDVLNDINETIYITKFDKHIKLQQENKILKENAENNDKVVDKVNWENMLLKKENEQLQKELEKADSITQSCIFNGKKESKISYRKCLNILDKKETQQKEFINYLEDEINKLKEQIKNYDIWHEVGTDINFLIFKKQFNKEILSKFKEIIGVSK